MKAIQITAPSEMKVVDIEKPVLEPGFFKTRHERYS